MAEVLVSVQQPATFLGLSSFTLDEADQGERLNLAITVLLTQVAFQYIVFEKLPRIPYLTFMHKYIIFSFAFTCAIVFESAIFVKVNHDFSVLGFKKEDDEDLLSTTLEPDEDHEEEANRSDLCSSSIVMSPGKPPNRVFCTTHNSIHGGRKAET